ncbi:MAG TPA: hypothetical protein VK973_11915 [Arenicellales bacterium]|nr:hypothetical protein [Arenicellales bacterium]
MVDTGRFLWVVFLACLIVEIALVYLDLTVNWWRWSDSGAIRRLFNTTREDGLASWFMVSQTLLAALAAWTVFAVVSRQRAALVRRLGWLLVAAFFSYMCLDDGALVHERIGTAVKSGGGIGGYPSYAWQYVLLPFFALMGAFVLYFLWKEMPWPAARARVAGAIACFVLAVGMDFVEGLDEGYRWLTGATGWRADTVRHFSKSLEEFIEMVGMSLFLVTFIGHLARVAPRIRIRFQDAGRA